MREIQKSSRYNNYIKAIKLIKLKRKVSTSSQIPLKHLGKMLTAREIEKLGN